MDPSLFFTNKIGAPHGEVFGLMNRLFNMCCNCSFNSFSYFNDIRYGGIDIGCIPGTKSISLTEGNPPQSPYF